MSGSHAADVIGAQRTDRQVGRLISLGGVVLVVGQVVPASLRSPGYPTWWNLGGILVTGTVVGLALAGKATPFGLLRIGWIGAPALGGLLALTSFLAYRGDTPDTTVPWVWTVEPVLVSYLVLWLRPPAAVALTVLSGCLPALSGLIALGHVPAAVASATPIHISNIGFTAVFIGMRARLNRLRVAESSAREQDRLSAQAVAEARRQEQLGRLIHDEVLSVLTAAMSFTGDPPGQLRVEAAHALTLLDAPRPDPEGQLQTTHTALTTITESLRRIDPDAPVRAQAVPGTVPDPAVEAITHAAAEALRNSARHAGPGCPREVDVRVAPGDIRVVVRDDGPGFDPRAVDPARLGVRESILARMTALDGGDARIHTSPGTGTEVVLTWRT